MSVEQSQATAAPLLQNDNATCRRAGERKAGAPLCVGELCKVVLRGEPHVAGADDGRLKVDDTCLAPSRHLSLPVAKEPRRGHNEDPCRLARRDECVDGGEHLEGLAQPWIVAENPAAATDRADQPANASSLVILKLREGARSQLDAGPAAPQDDTTPGKVPPPAPLTGNRTARQPRARRLQKRLPSRRRRRRWRALPASVIPPQRPPPA